MNILVIGDSHTDIDPKQNRGHEDISHLSYSWLYHAAKDNPDINFVSYALQGTSHFYFDLVLKHCMDKGFDACLVQLTGYDRFLIPTSDFNLTDIWKEQIITKNLTDVKLVCNHIKLFTNAIGIDESLNLQTKGVLTSIQNTFYNSMIPNTFTGLLIKSLDKLYSQIYKKLFYFSWETQSQKNNIDHPISVLSFLINKYGEKKLINDLMTDDLHLNYAGSLLAYQDYIKPFVLSKIL